MWLSKLIWSNIVLISLKRVERFVLPSSMVLCVCFDIRKVAPFLPENREMMAELGLLILWMIRRCSFEHVAPSSGVKSTFSLNFSSEPNQEPA